MSSEGRWRGKSGAVHDAARIAFVSFPLMLLWRDVICDAPKTSVLSREGGAVAGIGCGRKNEVDEEGPGSMMFVLEER